MFEAAELRQEVDKKDFKQRELQLREQLLELQRWAQTQKFPVVLVFSGVDGAGKSEIANLLMSWMDPRWIVTRAFSAPSEEERERPEYWRYWLALPPKGQIGIYLSTWYSRPLLDRVNGKITWSQFEAQLDAIRRFEGMLADDGALVQKFWLHLGKEDQKKRFRALEKNPLTRWRVSETDWHNWRLYDQFRDAAERLIQRTSTGETPWKIVEGWDSRFAALTVGETLRDALERRRQRVEARAAAAPPVEVKPKTRQKIVQARSVLSALDMSQSLKEKEYKTKLARLQGKLNELHRKAHEKQVSAILVFEGWDAAGKGGAIRRLTAALDARNYQVIPIAAPTDEERAHHYLWRFWRHLPRAGRVTIFDRSWYGRVLVERVEGFARESDWRRAYAEINDFEEQLVNHGIVLLKFWVHVSREEQLKRFKLREKTPHKQWKLTEEDWRNREKWGHYEDAVNDMVERTSTVTCPWTLVEGNDKRFTRVKVLKTLCDRLQKAVK